MEPLGLFKVNKDAPKIDEPAGPIPSPARIDIDVGQIIGEIDPYVYGTFIEKIGQCIEGIWDEENKQIPLLYNGLRTDVVKKIRALNTSIIRWPGGCFSDGYHWKDGIGPRDQRKTKKNRAWAHLGPKIGPKDNNHFGSDEFMLFLKEVGAEPYINVNFGSGTPEEAAQWVEYMNGDTSTEYGALRAKNGHPEPYNVKVWGIGNEIYGQHEIGYCKTGEKYAYRYIMFAKAMRAVDPSIKLVAVGTDFVWPEWNREFLKIASGYTDYLSFHVYIPGKFLLTLSNSVKNYYNIIAGAFELERRLNWVEQSIEDVVGDRKEIVIALDEWGPWWNVRQIYEGYYTLRDGLFTASVFELLHRHTETVKMANYAQIVNVLAMIMTTKTDLYCNPIYYAFRMFSNYSEKHGVSTSISSDVRINPKFGMIEATDIPYLGCSVTTNEDHNRLTIIGINRHHAHGLPTSISIKNFQPSPTARLIELNGLSHSAYNHFDKKKEVFIQEKDPLPVSSKFTYTFPAHSVTALLLQKET
ncbi:MAG: alpha-N-arabinofuranosidase [Candidatus Helarchaeota archaeon]